MKSAQRDLLKEGSGVWDRGKYDHFRQDYDLLHHIVNNGAGIFSRTCNVTSTNYYYALKIPANKRFVIWDWGFTGGEGAYDVNYVSIEDGTTGGNNAYKSQFRIPNGSSLDTNLVCGATPVGSVTIKEQGYANSGSAPGAATYASAASSQKALHIIEPSEIEIAIQITRRQSADYTANVWVIGWEEEL